MCMSRPCRLRRHFCMIGSCIACPRARHGLQEPGACTPQKVRIAHPLSCSEMKLVLFFFVQQIAKTNGRLYTSAVG